MAFKFEKLMIPEVILVKPDCFGDSRGFFMETFKRSLFAENGILEDFVQDNYSRSIKNVLRGLHFQKSPYAQGKLVKVLKGEIFDVAVDIRKDSETFGQWVGEILDDKEHKMLYIPPGFAHGFCVLSESVDFTYKVTAEYSPENDRGFLWNDPEIGIKWPIDQPILSNKDQKQPLLKDVDLD